MADGFADFAALLVPKHTRSKVAEANLAVIKRQLERHYAMSSLVPYGSSGHGTNVTEYSARDRFAVIPKSRLHELSGASLAEICELFKRKFPDAFVTEGRPVIAVPYGERLSERHHIVPAIFLGEDGGHDKFSIPAPRDRWVVVCPGAHSAWINRLDKELNNNLKPFIRMVKAWSYFNKQPIWSYYLELSVADFLKKDASIIYATDLKNFFAYMHKRNLEPFRNSAGCAKLVYGTSIAGKKTARAAIRDAVEFTVNARKCEEREMTAEAFYWLRKMFDWRFAPY